MNDHVLVMVIALWFWYWFIVLGYPRPSKNESSSENSKNNKGETTMFFSKKKEEEIQPKQPKPKVGDYRLMHNMAGMYRIELYDYYGHGEFGWRPVNDQRFYYFAEVLYHINKLRSDARREMDETTWEVVEEE